MTGEPAGRDGDRETGEPVRRGGRRIEGDRRTTWSVADGSRGRRWRTVSTDAGDPVVACTLETSPDGRFVKIEAASRDGLLTLHAEGDGSLHGHVVTPSGVRHLTLGRQAPALVLVEGDPFVAAALVGALADRVAVGATADMAAVVISRDLEVRGGALRVGRRTATSWELTALGAAGGSPVALEVGEDGIPVPGPGDAEWSLEL